MFLDPWDPKLARRILKRHRLEISECIHRQIKADPEIKGKLKVTFTVANNGKVLAVDITAPEFANTLIAKCVEKLILGIQFPSFKGQPQKVPFWFEVK